MSFSFLCLFLYLFHSCLHRESILFLFLLNSHLFFFIIRLSMSFYFLCLFLHSFHSCLHRHQLLSFFFLLKHTFLFHYSLLLLLCLLLSLLFFIPSFHSCHHRQQIPFLFRSHLSLGTLTFFCFLSLFFM